MTSSGAHNLFASGLVVHPKTVVEVGLAPSVGRGLAASCLLAGAR